MTLDDIRARDAADIPITLDMTGADWRRALWQVAADRRTLLGMLEPSAVPEHEPCCACCSEVDRLADELDGMTDTALDMARKYRQWRPPGSQAQRESAIAAERARIAEAVNRIPPGEFVRAAVLAAIGADR